MTVAGEENASNSADKEPTKLKIERKMQKLRQSNHQHNTKYTRQMYKQQIYTSGETRVAVRFWPPQQQRPQTKESQTCTAKIHIFSTLTRTRMFCNILPLWPILGGFAFPIFTRSPQFYFILGTFSQPTASQLCHSSTGWPKCKPLLLSQQASFCWTRVMLTCNILNFKVNHIH